MEHILCVKNEKTPTYSSFFRYSNVDEGIVTQFSGNEAGSVPCERIPFLYQSCRSIIKDGTIDGVSVGAAGRDIGALLYNSETPSVSWSAR